MPRAPRKKQPPVAPGGDGDATTTGGASPDRGLPPPDPALGPQSGSWSREEEEAKARAAGWTWPQDQTLATLTAALAERTAARDALEAYEASRAKTPLALVLEVVSCHWAAVTWPDQATVPIYKWPTRKCYQGKQVPDQDCRLCRYCQVLRYGTQEPHHTRRYHEHGMVLPVPTERADELAGALREKGLAPLRSVDAEIDALGSAVEALRLRREEDRQRDIEQRQRGPRPAPPR